VSWSPSEISGTGTLTSRVYFPCKLRSTFGGSSITLSGYWYGDAAANYTVYAIKDGVSIVSGSLTSSGAHYATWSFNPLSDTVIDGFEIALNSGLGSVIDYVPTDTIASGSATATDSVGTPVTTVVGQYYAVESLSGSFDPDGAGVLPLAYGVSFTTVSIVTSITVSAPAWIRAIQIATATTHNVTVLDNPGQFADNTGGPITWVVRNVEARGRRIRLSNTEINNVCAI
jgi:hypothetical protein